MTEPRLYTTQLGAGFGMLHETRVLLDLWQPGMDAAALRQTALDSGRFSNITARRLRNMVSECFAPRYLIDEERPARLLLALRDVLAPGELDQVLFLYTCRANRVLADFIKEVYWPRYAAGHDNVSNKDAREFVEHANRDGKTAKPWGDSMLERVSEYLTRTCGDFGLLESGRKVKRKILPFRILPRTAAVVAYEMHFAGLGDNSLVAHEDWGLFGLDRADVVDLLKRLSLNGHFIVQAAGDVTRIAWKYKNLEELADGLAQS